MSNRTPKAKAILTLISATWLCCSVAAAAEPVGLSGTWKPRVADANGKHMAHETSKEQVWTFTADTFVIRYDNGERMEATYRLDATVTPHTIAIEWTAGWRKGQNTVGIWESTGDTLRLCWSSGRQLKAFEEEFEDRGRRYYVLERQGIPNEVPAASLARIGRWNLAHLDGVSCAAFSPDGKTLATGGHDRFVRLWERATGKELHALRHSGWVRSLVWSPDGETLFAASDNEGITTWEASTGKELNRHKIEGMVTSLALTRDGRTLAWCEGEKTVVVWDVPGDRERYRFQAEHRAYRLAFATDGTTLAVGGEPEKVLRCDTATGRELPALVGHEGGTYAVAFSPDGKLIASAGTYPDGRIHLWDAASGKELRRWKASPSAVYALAFSPDSQSLLSGQGGKADPVRLWNVADGKEVRSFRGPVGVPDSLAFTPDGKYAVSSGCHERGVFLWDVATGEEVSPFPRHHGEVKAIAFAPSGKLLATGSTDRTVGLWEPQTGKPAGRLSGHLGVVRAVAFSPSGALLATAAEREGVVRLWSVEKKETIRELKGDRQTLGCLAFSPDGTVLAAGENDGGPIIPGAKAADGSVWVWEAATGKKLHRAQGVTGRVNGVAFSPDGQTLAVGGLDDDTIHIVDVQVGDKQQTFKKVIDPAAPRGPFEGTAALTISPDGRTLASVVYHDPKHNLPTLPANEGNVPTVRLWEMSTGQVRHEVRLARNSVKSISFVNGRFLALGGRHGEVRIHDLAKDEFRPPVHGHRDGVESLAVSADGRWLASGSDDTTALVWKAAALTGPQDAQERRATADFGALWRDLQGPDAGTAYRSVWSLATNAESVRWLENQVRPIPVVDAGQLKSLAAQLDSEDFKTREKATAELRHLHEKAIPTLKEFLEGKLSLEARRRAEDLLARLESGADEAATQRVLEVLESIGTPEAIRLLEALAKGSPEARQTREAGATLQRLQRQP